jgi:hypothetical protein
MGDILSKGVDILSVDDPMSMEAIHLALQNRQGFRLVGVENTEVDQEGFNKIFKKPPGDEMSFEEVHRLKSRREALFDLFDTDCDGVVNVLEM